MANDNSSTNVDARPINSLYTGTWVADYGLVFTGTNISTHATTIDNQFTSVEYNDFDFIKIPKKIKRKLYLNE